MLTNDDLEKILSVNEDIRLLERYIREISDYPYICFVGTKIKNCSFWDANKERVKRNRGFPKMLDVPEDLKIRDAVVRILTDKLNELKSFKNKYVKN